MPSAPVRPDRLDNLLALPGSAANAVYAGLGIVSPGLPGSGIVCAGTLDAKLLTAAPALCANDVALANPALARSTPAGKAAPNAAPASATDLLIFSACAFNIAGPSWKTANEPLAAFN